jgi:hypothetical protein
MVPEAHYVHDGLRVQSAPDSSNVPQSGAFLMEFAAWECTQQEFMVITVRTPATDDDRVSLGLGTGRSLKVPLSSERQQIHHVIRTVLPDASLPEVSIEGGEVLTEASGREVWEELLDDLGA